MKIRIFTLSVLCFYLFLAGCAPTSKQNPWPDAPVLGHLDISQKKTYIQSVKNSLRTYRLLAEDLGQRQKPESFSALGAEADKFIHLYVLPIVDDPEASSHIETKLDIAKLQLISGYTYAELDMIPMAKQQHEQITNDFGSDLSIMDATLGEPGLNHATIGDGVNGLKQKTSRR
jgi:hypothetical protein